MTAIANHPLPPLISPEADQRYVLIQVSETKLIFPAHWVAETLIIERSRLLALPFYDSALMGCFHHNVQIIPLVSTHQILGLPEGAIQEQLIVLRLGLQVGSFVNVGLTINKVIGTKTKTQLPPEFLSVLEDASPSAQDIRLFSPDILHEKLFQPQRWVTG